MSDKPQLSAKARGFHLSVDAWAVAAALALALLVRLNIIRRVPW